MRGEKSRILETDICLSRAIDSPSQKSIGARTTYGAFEFRIAPLGRTMYQNPIKSSLVQAPQLHLRLGCLIVRVVYNFAIAFLPYRRYNDDVYLHGGLNNEF